MPHRLKKELRCEDIGVPDQEALKGREILLKLEAKEKEISEMLKKYDEETISKN